LVERTTIAGETEELGENLPQRHFVPPQIPHGQVRLRTPDRSGGKPATNRLSYGAAFFRKKVTVPKFNEVKTGSNLAEYSKERHGSKSAVLPMAMMLI
jgi:hypothetical protein